MISVYLKSVILVLILYRANALYSSADSVIELTSSNFESKVIKNDGVWVVEFYSPQCGHCVNFAPAYKEAARILKGIINVAAVDVSQYQDIAQKYGIRGYPTVKIFGSDKANPVEFNGQRTAESIFSEAFNEAKKLVNRRLGKSSDKSEGSSGDADIIELTETNFDKLVLKSSDSWLIGFFAPWCGHCQRLKPEYEVTARKMKGKMKVGSVDATVHQQLAAKYDVKGYPTLYYFGPEKTKPESYEGGRTSDDMIKFLNDKLVANLPPPKADELINPDQLEICQEKQLCVIVALPDLLDCQSKCRKNYISMLESAAAKHKTSDWKYFWFPATMQPDAEKVFNLGGFGYPALVAANAKKQKYAPMRGSFSVDGIHEFLRDVSLGSRSISLQEISSMPKINKNEPWDGKDGKVQEIEEIDLDDLKDEL